MSFKKEYAEKLISAEAAAKLIKEDDWVDFGWGVGLPHDLDKAVADHIVANDIRGLKFRGGVVLRKPEIFKIENAPEHLCWNSWHMTGIERKSIEVNFSVGSSVRVTGGAFSDFVGVVDEINTEKQSARVIVSMFGRETPVELDFSQIEVLD